MQATRDPVQLTIVSSLTSSHCKRHFLDQHNVLVPAVDTALRLALSTGKVDLGVVYCPAQLPSLSNLAWSAR
jgi:hypothetical protein